VSKKQTHEQRQAKTLLHPMHLSGMLLLSLDAAVREGICDSSRENLLLTDLPAVTASKYTRTQESLNTNSTEIMKLV